MSQYPHLSGLDRVDAAPPCLLACGREHQRRLRLRGPVDGADAQLAACERVDQGHMDGQQQVVTCSLEVRVWLLQQLHQQCACGAIATHVRLALKEHARPTAYNSNRYRERAGGRV